MEVRKTRWLDSFAVPPQRGRVGFWPLQHHRISGGIGKRGFMDDFRRLFFRGLAALVPTLLTIAILIWAYRLLNDNVGVYINKALLSFCCWSQWW